MISGIGVFYPDKKPTQRVGIVPDIGPAHDRGHPRRSRRSGRRALRQILGPGTAASEIERMARR